MYESNASFQDEKYLLKFHTGSGVVTGGGRDDAKKIHSPVIKSVPPTGFSTSSNVSFAHPLHPKVIKSVPTAFCALYQIFAHSQS